MQLANDGSPIITTPQDQQKANRFVDRVVDMVYDRLPRIVKIFLSRERLAELLRSGIQDLAQGL